VRRSRDRHAAVTSAKRSPSDASAVSRPLHVLSAWSSKAATAAIAAVASVVVLGWALLSRDPDQILIWFAGVAGSVTLVMVFVLQHTQTRQQEALHHKLDEVLHALPEADNKLIKLETASDSDLVEVELRHAALRDDARDA
jgi:low affinity Fe/Cu permease